MASLSTLAVSFARRQRAEGKAPATIQSYGACVAALATQLGDVDIKDISRRAMSDFFLARQDTCKAVSVAKEFRSLAVFMKWCVLEDEIEVSPMVGLKPPRVVVVPVPTFSDRDLSTLLTSCEGRGYRDRRDLAMLRLLMDTGVRRSELANLALGDLDLDAQVASVTGKGKSRLVSFGNRTAVALDRWLRVRRDSSTVFGLTPSGVYQALKDRAASAGVEGWHTHRHRHDVAHRWLAAGGSEGDLMSLAGWSSRSLLDRYGASQRSARAIDAHRRLALGDRY